MAGRSTGCPPRFLWTSLGFYRDAMPVGEPFGDLEWCGYAPVPQARTLEWVWRVPGTQDFHALQVYQDNGGPL